MTVLTRENFAAEVLEAEQAVVVDFWATWCGPCMMLKPVFEAVSKELPQAKFCKLDIDDERELAIQYGIESIPTLLVFKGGKVVQKLVGLRDQAKLRAELEEWV